MGKQFKRVSVHKLNVVFVVIHEIWNKSYCFFFLNFTTHNKNNMEFVGGDTFIFFRFISFFKLNIFFNWWLYFSSWYLVPKIKPNFDPQYQNLTWNTESRNHFSDLKGKDVVGMKKMLYKECAAWIACRQLLPAIALASALEWLFGCQLLPAEFILCICDWSHWLLP